MALFVFYILIRSFTNLFVLRSYARFVLVYCISFVLHTEKDQFEMKSKQIAMFAAVVAVSYC